MTKFEARTTEYYTIETLVPILTNGLNLLDLDDHRIINVGTTATGSAITQKSMDAIIETISLNGQPIMIGHVIGYRDTVENLAAKGLYGTDSGDGKITVYKVVFAIEHVGVWTETKLEDALNDSNHFINDKKSPQHNNIVVSISNTP